MARRVLVAHGDAEYLTRLVAGLGETEAEIEIVGPADRAATALALAAIQPIDAAIVGRELAGRRDGPELVKMLERDWGIASIVIDTPEPDALILETDQ